MIPQLRLNAVLLCLCLCFMNIARAQSVVYESLLTESDFQNRTIDLAKPVGVIDGVGDVSATGAATYTLPIVCPPGTAGMNPGLSVTYSSQSGTGWLGMGWNLSGLSSVTRTGLSSFYDGMSWPVGFSLNDRFAIDGKRLLLATGTYGSNGSTYTFEEDDYSVITAHGSTGNGPEWFEVKKKDGSKMYYGTNYTTTGSRFTKEGGSDVWVWQLSRIEDVNGNYIDYIYDTDNTSSGRYTRLDEIRYTGNAAEGLVPYNTIKFNYANNTDGSLIYQTGSKHISNKVITSIQVFGLSGQVYKYEFKYSNNDIHTLLNRVKLFNSSGDQLNETVFRYGSNTSTPPVTVLTNLEFNPGFSLNADYRLVPGDFNGDGLSDLLYIDIDPNSLLLNRVETNTMFKVLRNDGQNNYTEILNSYINLLPNSKIHPSGFNRLNYYDKRNTLKEFVSDFDGNGSDDLMFATLTPYNGNTTGHFNSDHKFNAVTIYKSDPSDITFTQQNISAPLVNGVFYNHLSNTLHHYLLTGDFDGDGFSDVLTIVGALGQTGKKAFVSFVNKSSINNEVQCVSQPFAASQNPLEYFDSVSASKYIYVADFDGDGRDELMCVKQGETVVFKIEKVGSTYFLVKQFTSGFPTIWHDVWLGDFNGDGKTDLLTNSSMPGTYSIGYSTGVGIHQEILFLNKAFNKNYSVKCGSTTHTLDEPNSDNIFIVDLNCDGLSDIMHYRIEMDCSKTERLIDVYINRGHVSSPSTDKFKLTTYPDMPTLNDRLGHLGDFNGDGVPDLMYRASIYPTDKLAHLFIRNRSAEHTLLESADGLNRKTKFEYEPLSWENQDVYTFTGPSMAPVNTIIPPLNVVKNMSFSNGLGNGLNVKTYAYSDLKMHRGGRGVLGFSQVKMKDDESNVTLEKNYAVDPTYFVMNEVSVKLWNDAQLLSESVPLFTFSGTLPGSRFYRRLVQQQVTNHLSGVSTLTNLTYDSYGNVLTKTDNIQGGLEVSQTEYSNFSTGAGTVPWLPEKVVVTNTRSGQLAATSETRYTYDSRGRMQTEKYYADGLNENYRKTLTYDGFGNVVNENVYSALAAIYGAGVYNKTESSTYDLRGRYKLTHTNALGQVSSKVWHQDFGKPLSETGIDGLTVVFGYDGWGNIVNVTDPLSLTTAIEKGWGTVSDQASEKYYYEKTTSPGAPVKKVWHDRLGRITEVETDHYGVGQKTTSRTAYDSKGNTLFSVKAHLPGEPVIKTTFSYDAYNRLTSEVTQLDATTIGTKTYSYGYSGGNTIVSVTEPDGLQHSSVTDAAGRVTQSTDKGGLLKFTYNSRGQKLSIQHGATTLITNTYDAGGNLVKSTDVNAGEQVFTYDGFGRMTSSKTANNKITNYHYDILGRIAYKTVDGQPVTFQYYGSGQNGINQISQRAFNGVVEEWDYDVYGRVVERQKIIPGRVAELKSYSYDTYGRLKYECYGNYHALVYDYTGKGFLDKVTFSKVCTSTPSGSNTRVIFDGVEMNGDGQFTEYVKLQSQVPTLNTYELGLLTSTYTSGIQHLEMTYDPVFPMSGNLESRTDHLKQKRDEFTYDYLKRLSGMQTVDMSPIAQTYPLQEYLYDGNTSTSKGNIKFKTDVGNYVNIASGGKFHAVRSVPLPSIIPDTTQDIAFNAYNRAELIEEGSKKVELLYDADYERSRMKVYENNIHVKTRYYYDDYEITVDESNGQEERTYYASGGDGLCALIHYNYGSSNTSMPVIAPVFTDHLGSLLKVTNGYGVTLFEQNFDAWGRKRHPYHWDYSAYTAVPAFEVYRGYTGHEHLDEFGLINMNARLYDPVLGRMLSPDPYIMGAYNTQGYNRYTYALNNPLKYTDPTGEIVWAPIIIGAVVGAYIGGTMANNGNYNPTQWDYNSGRTWGYMGAGSVIGGVSAWAGGAVAAGVGQSMTFAGAGTVAGAAGGAVGGAISGGGFAALGGRDIGEGIWKGALSGFVGGGVGSYIGGGWGAFAGGATSGGVGAAMYGGDAGDIAMGALLGGTISWSGYQIQQGATYRQYKNGAKPFGSLTRQGFRKMSVATQRSFARGREAGGWILSNGDVGDVVYGGRGGVNLPNKPVGGVANFHTHPNDPGTIQFHSLTDLVGEQNINYVIGWNEIYRNNPNTHPLPSNYGTFSESYIYNTLIPSLITTYPNSLNPYPYYWFYFGR